MAYYLIAGGYYSGSRGDLKAVTSSSTLRKLKSGDIRSTEKPTSYFYKSTSSGGGSTSSGSTSTRTTSTRTSSGGGGSSSTSTKTTQEQLAEIERQALEAQKKVAVLAEAEKAGMKIEGSTSVEQAQAYLDNLSKQTTTPTTTGGTSTASDELRNLSIGLTQEGGSQITQADIDAGKFETGGEYDYVTQMGLEDNGASDALRNLSIGMVRDPQNFQQSAQVGQVDPTVTSTAEMAAQEGMEPQLSQTGQAMQGLGLQFSGTPTPESNPSVVDFMNATGLASDFGARSTLAEAMGIPNYVGSAEQNTEMLKRLREEQAGKSNIAAGINSGMSPSNQSNLDWSMQVAGYQYNPVQVENDIVGELSTFIEMFMDNLGMGEISVLSEAEADELEELENKRDQELRDVDDNPWLTEGVRLRQRRKVEEKYQDEIGNKEAKLARLQRNKELMVQQSQWALGTAISLWDSDRRFQQAQAQALYDRQQDALEWKYRQMSFDADRAEFALNYNFKVSEAQRQASQFQQQYALDEAKFFADQIGSGYGTPQTFINEFGQTIEGSAPSKDPTAGERSSFTFFQRISDAVNVIEGYPDVTLDENLLTQAVLNQNWAILQSPEQQIVAQAMRQFTEARLRKDSGAAIPPEEFANDRRTYFPQVGESTPVLERKAEARYNTLNAMRAASGNAYHEWYGEAPSVVGQRLLREAQIPKPGDANFIGPVQPPTAEETFNTVVDTGGGGLFSSLINGLFLQKSIY